jgi:uncharacterized membrane protein YadS
MCATSATIVPVGSASTCGLSAVVAAKPHLKKRAEHTATVEMSTKLSLDQNEVSHEE